MPAAGVGLQGAADRKGATEMADLSLLGEMTAELDAGCEIAAAVQTAERATWALNVYARESLDSTIHRLSELVR